jgi:glycosyltransferase involved in cell wall biosynthesis
MKQIPTVLLVSNQRLDDNTGRAEKFATRARLLRDRGWDLQLGYVEPTVTGLPVGAAQCSHLAREVDVINSVSNPPHLQIAGAIAAHMTGTPWLAEFRDPLVENPDVTHGSLAARARRRLERYILTHADRVVWYDGIQVPNEYFAREYPEVPEERYRQLPPIGFERTVFESIEAREFDRLTVTYAGSFYEGWIEPYTFLDGLGSYLDGEEDTSPADESHDGDVQALFYGDWNEDYDRAAREAGASACVESNPFVPHEEIVAVLEGPNALLYVGGSDPRNRHNLPSKLYDYIGAQRPIIAIVDPGFRAAEVIREHGFGIVVEPGDTEGVRRALERIGSGEFTYDPNQEAVARFTRERSTDTYLQTLETLIGR